ncbi:MAG: hypothetical protein U0U70_13490 [Chitinophagaceae bacterium]
MKKNISSLGKSLTKSEQKNVNGGLKDNCWCLFPSQAGQCWHIYWNQPCGQPGQYVICKEILPPETCIVAD